MSCSVRPVRQFSSEDLQTIVPPQFHAHAFYTERQQHWTDVVVDSRPTKLLFYCRNVIWWNHNKSRLMAACLTTVWQHLKWSITSLTYVYSLCDSFVFDGLHFFCCHVASRIGLYVPVSFHLSDKQKHFLYFHTKVHFHTERVRKQI